MEPTLLAFAVILGSLAALYLQPDDQLPARSSIWIEWVIWGLITLFSRLCSCQTVVGDEVVEDKEAQILPKWSKPSLEKPATVLAALFFGVFLIQTQHQNSLLQWSYVSLAQGILAAN